MAGKEGKLDGDALLKRKAEEEMDKILVAEILHKRPGAAASSEVTEPMLVDLAKAADTKEAVSEPQAEDDYQDGYEDDEGEEDYQDEAEDDYDYGCDYEEEENGYEPQFLEQRDKVMALVSNFPEAAHLQLDELDKVVDRIVEQSKPQCSDLAAAGKIRLLSRDIELAVVPDWFYDDTPLADSIQKHEEPDRDMESLPLNGKYDQDQEGEQFRAKVRKDLIHKGYVEVDEDYYDKKEECERQMMQKMEEEWNQKMYPSRFRAANNDEGILYYSKEHGGYI